MEWKEFKCPYCKEWVFWSFWQGKKMLREFDKSDRRITGAHDCGNPKFKSKRGKE